MEIVTSSAARLIACMDSLTSREAVLTAGAERLTSDDNGGPAHMAGDTSSEARDTFGKAVLI